jgi:predicted  nucleic acid-binding Zn-ribbon protein
MSDQSNIAELERRITAALARIGAGLDTWQPIAPVVTPATPEKPASAPEPAAAPAVDPAHEQKVAGLQAEIAALKAALATETAQVAQLTERLKAAKERGHSAQGPLEAKVEKMTEQLDVQGLELQRMRKSTVQLREHLRVLHEAAADNMVEPQLINKAMLAELESLRATRHTETAEMDEILAALKPLIEEARTNG